MYSITVVFYGAVKKSVSLTSFFFVFLFWLKCFEIGALVSAIGKQGSLSKDLQSSCHVKIRENFQR